MAKVITAKTKAAKVTSLKFSNEDTSREEIKERLHGTPGLLKLSISECQVFDDEGLSNMAPLLNRELYSFSVYRGHLSDRGVQTILQQCPKLQHLTFVGCKHIGADSIRSLGRLCQKLKSVEFIYQESTAWSLTEDALSELVKNCASELVSLSFVGFKAITDIGVNYASECYFNTLRRVNFSHCSQLTDHSLIGLANLCRYLKDVSLHSTAVSDVGIKVLVEKCPRLHRVDFGNCRKVTDAGVMVLADQCERLEQLNVEGCVRLTDDSLSALITHCAYLHSLNMSGTSLNTVPVGILALRRLKLLQVRNCANLIKPPKEFVDRDLDGIFDYYKSYNLSYKVKVFLLGEAGAGKSSVVQSLIKGAPTLVTQPTEGVTLHPWQPCNNDTSSACKLEEKQLTLDFWDLAGKQMCQGAHQLCYTPDALYIVIFNASNKASCDRLNAHVNAIQCKAPGSRVIIVGTHLDRLPKKHDLNKKSEEILFSVLNSEKQSIKNIKTEVDKLKKLHIDHKILHRLEDLDLLLLLRPKLPTNVHFVSCKDGQGLEDVRKELVSQALTPANCAHLGDAMQPGTIHLYERVMQARCSGTVLQTWQQYKDMATSGGAIATDDDLETYTNFLQVTGGILDFRFLDVGDCDEDVVRYICVDPVAFTNAACALHVDNPKKSFKVDAGRFWPAGSGVKKPDPGLLVRALEDIPTRGLLREPLFPILWQGLDVEESQVMMMLDLLERLGILALQNAVGDHRAGLAMPGYSKLSVRRCYCAPLMGLMPAHKPELNWAPMPFQGDIQLNWRYEFPNSIPRGLIRRLYAVCRKAQRADGYCYIWTDGILMVAGEAVVHVRHEQNYVEVCCRVNADELGQERLAMEILWASISPFIFAAHQFLISWTGLFFKVSLLSFGSPLFKGVFICRAHSIDLFKCFELHQKAENFCFLEDNIERELDLDLLLPFSEHRTVEAYLHYILTRSSTILSLMDSGALPEVKGSEAKVKGHITATHSKIAEKDKRKLKKVQIKWQLEPSVDAAKLKSKPKISVHNGVLFTTKSIHGDINQNTDSAGAGLPPNAAEGRQDKRLSGLPEERLSTGQLSSLTGQRDLRAEEEQQAASHVAAGFVAALLAGAVAVYIRQLYEENRGTTTISEAQVEAAQLTANAAKATQSGNMEDAARAVMAAANRVQTILDKHSTDSTDYRSMKSKLCVLL